MNLKVKLALFVTVIALFGSMATVLAATNQHAKTHHFKDSDDNSISGDVNGSSAKLTRGDDSISIKVNTTGLPVGAYTTWWVIWNDPSECTGTAPLLCGPADLGSASNSVFYASGGVTNSNGVGHFGATLEEGGIPGGLVDLPNADPDDQVRISNGNGLGDAQTAEVHYIIRYHGPASDDAGELEKQITTIGGLCSEFNQPQGCYDPQAVGFPAP